MWTRYLKNNIFIPRVKLDCNRPIHIGACPDEHYRYPDSVQTSDSSVLKFLTPLFFSRGCGLYLFYERFCFSFWFINNLFKYLQSTCSSGISFFHKKSLRGILYIKLLLFKNRFLFISCNTCVFFNTLCKQMTQCNKCSNNLFLYKN